MLLRMDESLDVRVKEQLGKRKGDWQSIAVAAEVSYSWLSKFYNGHIDNPGYATLRRLDEHLRAAEAS